MSTAVGAADAAEFSIADASSDIAALLGVRATAAQWWVDLATMLDHLRHSMAAHHLDATGRRELREQIRKDAPHLFFRIRRLESEAEELDLEMMRVRLMVGDSAGDPHAAGGIGQAVTDLLDRIRRHEQHSREVLLDAYERDLGGE